MAVLVNRAVTEGLAASRAILEARRIRVDLRLDARHRLSTHDDVLYEAVRTLFAALPDRLVEGSTLTVTTEDRAGGDVELAWTCQERAPADDDDPRRALAAGRTGDLVALALAGLEDLCRARGAMRRETTGAATRCTLLLPSLRRA